eukprot:scaffold603_cov404-Prasinococcus_capsulatus_cf.AAC.8
MNVHTNQAKAAAGGRMPSLASTPVLDANRDAGSVGDWCCCCLFAMAGSSPRCTLTAKEVSSLLS